MFVLQILFPQNGHSPQTYVLMADNSAAMKLQASAISKFTFPQISSPNCHNNLFKAKEPAKARTRLLGKVTFQMVVFLFGDERGCIEVMVLADGCREG